MGELGSGSTGQKLWIRFRDVGGNGRAERFVAVAWSRVGPAKTES